MAAMSTLCFFAALTKSYAFKRLNYEITVSCANMTWSVMAVFWPYVYVPITYKYKRSIPKLSVFYYCKF